MHTFVKSTNVYFECTDVDFISCYGVLFGEAVEPVDDIHKRIGGLHKLPVITRIHFFVKRCKNDDEKKRVYCNIENLSEFRCKLELRSSP
jgi:hypothetical protein